MGVEICLRCRREPPSFDQAVSGCLYEGSIQRLILDLKYNKRLSHAPFLGSLLCQTIDQRLPCPMDAVLPVPLYPTRQRQRTFNQAEVLGRIVAERLGLPLWADLLVRTRSTRPQSELNRAHRLKNVRGAFAMRASHDVRGLELLLVDDLLTTGATAQACSLLLKKKGAARVCVATVAHG